MPPKPASFDLRSVVADTPENREGMIDVLKRMHERCMDIPYQGFPLWLVVAHRNGKLAFMTGSDAKDSSRFVIAQFNHEGLKMVNLPIHEVLWIPRV